MCVLDQDTGQQRRVVTIDHPVSTNAISVDKITIGTQTEECDEATGEVEYSKLNVVYAPPPPAIYTSLAAATSTSAECRNKPVNDYENVKEAPNASYINYPTS